jgi:hypothetical protein
MATNNLQNITALPLTSGYLTGECATAEQLLAARLSNDELLNLLLLADAREAEKHSHRTPPPDNWIGVREKTGVLLMRRLTGVNHDPAHEKWRDGEADWHERKFRDAVKALPKMEDGGLLTLFIQASENAYIDEGRPMQARWERVASRCRAEILRRIAGASLSSAPEIKAQSADPSHVAILTEEDAEDEEYLSLRQILATVEAAFRPDMPDDKLLDLYLVVDFHGGPDAEVFDEILKEITDTLFLRLRTGSPENDPDLDVQGFDPDEEGRALQALLGGELSHRNLVVLYRISFNNAEPVVGDKWTSINDLCRAQILSRMLTVEERGRHQADFIWQFVDNAYAASDQGKGQ